MPQRIQRIRGLAWLSALAFFLSACLRGGPPPTPSRLSETPGSQTAAIPSPSLTPFQPSATPPPLAARVNGNGINLSEYQAELARYQAAAGRELTEVDKKRVLDDLINQALLAQAAAEKGFIVDEATLKEHLDSLTAQLGGTEAIHNWMASNGYVEETFRADLARSIAAAWMRDQITSAVPETAEQVHARQILLTSAQQANDVLAQLQSGQDFAKLANEYDPVTRGDLGWFPRGYLTDPRLEEAAFSLEPGKYSDVIQTLAGYHILQIIERDPQHPLQPDARLALQAQALKDWIEAQRSQSNIQVLVP